MFILFDYLKSPLFQNIEKMRSKDRVWKLRPVAIGKGYDVDSFIGYQLVSHAVEHIL